VIYIREFGSGPSVVLLHGSLSPRDHLQPLIDALDGDHRVVVPDLPGYGKTPGFPLGWRVETLWEELERALEQRGVREAAVVGYSFGAYLALGLATRRRLRVSRLALLAASAALAPEGRAAMAQFIGALRAGVDLRGALVPRFLAPKFAEAHPDVAAQVVAWLDSISAENLARELEAVVAGPELTDALSTLEQPVVARVGERDAAAPVGNSRAIVERLRHGQLEVVPGAGHALLYEDRDATVAAVRRALSSGA
jgi:pimeloyl-ACP methyl ester carboxylesterase